MSGTTINDTVRNDPTSREPSGSAGRSWVAAGLLALCSTISCGAPSEAIDDSEQSGSRSDAFVATGPNSTEFKTLSPTIQPPNGVGDPGFCTPNGAHSKIMFSRDTTGYVQGQADVVGIQGVWGKYGGSASLRKFDSRPVCAFLPGTTSPYSFIILARGVTASDGTSDKRLFWSRGQWTVSETAPPPASVTQWAMTTVSSKGTTGPAVVSAARSRPRRSLPAFRGQLPKDRALRSLVEVRDLPARKEQRERVPLLHDLLHYDQFLERWWCLFRILTARRCPGGAKRFRVRIRQLLSSRLCHPLLPQRDAPLSRLCNRQLLQRDDVQSRHERRRHCSGNPLAIGGVPYEAGRHWLLIRGTDGILWGETFNDENLAVN
jgi:hypothetical protein